MNRIENFQGQNLWLLLAGLIAAVAFWLLNQRAERNRSREMDGRIGKAISAPFAKPLPGDLAFVARVGENTAPRETLGTLILRPTPGLQLLTAGLNLALLAMIWGDVIPGAVPPYPVIQYGFTAMCLFSCWWVFGFEARLETDSLVITRWGLPRAEYLLRHFISIRNDQHYSYNLTFAPGGTVRIPKYLVGMPQLLKVLSESLNRNDNPYAGAARG